MNVPANLRLKQFFKDDDLLHFENQKALDQFNLH